MKRRNNYWNTYRIRLLIIGGTVLICAYLIYEYWSLLGAYESSSATLRNLAIVAAAVIGLPFALIRSLTALQSLLDDRYQKSAEMLGSKILAVRIGGIVGLWHVAHGFPQTHHIQTLRITVCFYPALARRRIGGYWPTGRVVLRASASSYGARRCTGDYSFYQQPQFQTTCGRKKI